MPGYIIIMQICFLCSAKHCVSCGSELPNYEMKALKVHYCKDNSSSEKYVLCICHKTLLEAHTCVFR